MPSDAARLLSEASEAFYVPLRDGLGFDKERFQALCDALRFCAREWEKADVIPKLAANVFVDLFSSIESCASLYDEKTGEKILAAADTAADLARRCVMVNPSENS